MGKLQVVLQCGFNETTSSEEHCSFVGWGLWQLLFGLGIVQQAFKGHSLYFESDL